MIERRHAALSFGPALRLALSTRIPIVRQPSPEFFVRAHGTKNPGGNGQWEKQIQWISSMCSLRCATSLRKPWLKQCGGITTRNLGRIRRFLLLIAHGAAHSKGTGEVTEKQINKERFTEEDATGADGGTG